MTRRLIAVLVLVVAACTAQPGSTPPARYSVDTQCKQDSKFVTAYQALKARDLPAISTTRSQLAAAASVSGEATLLRTLARQLRDLRTGVLALPKTSDAADQVAALATSLQTFADAADSLATNPLADSTSFQQAAQGETSAAHDLDLQVLFMQGQCT